MSSRCSLSLKTCCVEGHQLHARMSYEIIRILQSVDRRYEFCGFVEVHWRTVSGRTVSTAWRTRVIMQIKIVAKREPDQVTRLEVMSRVTWPGSHLAGLTFILRLFCQQDADTAPAIYLSQFFIRIMVMRLARAAFRLHTL